MSPVAVLDNAILSTPNVKTPRIVRYISALLFEAINILNLSYLIQQSLRVFLEENVYKNCMLAARSDCRQQFPCLTLVFFQYFERHVTRGAIIRVYAFLAFKYVCSFKDLQLHIWASQIIGGAEYSAFVETRCVLISWEALARVCRDDKNLGFFYNIEHSWF